MTGLELSFQVNLFFLLNIVRVLITKLKVTHKAEFSLYMKAVRATLILIPLLGIHFVLLPYKGPSEVYQYVMNIFIHTQVRTNYAECAMLVWFKLQENNKVMLSQRAKVPLIS